MRLATILSLLCLVGFPSIAARAADCQDHEDIRQKAECIHDTLKPDVIARLLRLALSTVQGRSADEPPSQDFLYIAEEAGEAARRTNLQPVIDLCKTKDINQTIFAARAITAFLDAAEHGYSHNRRFNHTGDPALFAKARPTLQGPCDRLAKHPNATAQAEGKRCLDQLRRDRDKLGKLLAEPADMKGIKPVPVGSPGGLRVSEPRITPPKKHDRRPSR